MDCNTGEEGVYSDLIVHLNLNLALAAGSVTPNLSILYFLLL